jgi:hypothetical protein
MDSETRKARGLWSSEASIQVEGQKGFLEEEMPKHGSAENP